MPNLVGTTSSGKISLQGDEVDAKTETASLYDAALQSLLCIIISVLHFCRSIGRIIMDLWTPNFICLVGSQPDIIMSIRY